MAYPFTMLRMVPLPPLRVAPQGRLNFNQRKETA
jgi:hypothetical protein